MKNTSETKLIHAFACKEDIRLALNEGGINVDETVPFRMYGDKVREKGGGDIPEISEFQEYTIDLKGFGSYTYPHNIYSKALPNGKILFSSNQNNSGILVFDLNTNTIERKWLGDCNWNFFHIIGNDCLIGSNVYQGVLFYDSFNNTIEQLYSTGYDHRMFRTIGSDCLICSSSYNGILLYDSTTKTITRKFSRGCPWVNFHMVENGCFISSDTTTGTNNAGLLFYNSITKTIEEVVKNGRWTSFQNIEKDCLIGGGTLSSGIIFYDGNTRTSTLITEFGKGWGTFHKIDENYLIGGVGADGGVLFFNGINKSITRKYSGGNFSRFQIIDDTKNCLIGSYATGPNNLLLYNNEEQTATPVEQMPIDFEARYFYPIDNGCLISGGSSTSVTGILFYDYLTNSLSKIYDSGYNWQYFQKVGSDCLICSSSSNGILLYDSSTKKITSLYSYRTNWKFFQIVGNNCLISGEDTDSGIKLYNSSTKKITSLMDTGRNWNIFYTMNNKCYISSDYTSTGGLYCYDYITQKIEQLTYYNYRHRYIEINEKRYLIPENSYGYVFDIDIGEVIPIFGGKLYKNFIVASNMVYNILTKSIKIFTGTYSTQILDVENDIMYSLFSIAGTSSNVLLYKLLIGRFKK